ncbi:hypothetical protein VFPPC_15655 [Pochonia chlamydosporia 170]|uniref:Uncharacterized protein n=1 Tax=Pochonia chlamydosporia 170 TaxID=1380566 RepID=A0A179G1I7_METCM|nr:hypothetical protein VFPPC_15655 [Pochonia chlamydosporia 170]OAQ71089.1 hypothetical protein VFPPC_15655 [Pochonia chlamydosporia 170]
MARHSQLWSHNKCKPAAPKQEMAHRLRTLMQEQHYQQPWVARALTGKVCLVMLEENRRPDVDTGRMDRGRQDMDRHTE